MFVAGERQFKISRARKPNDLRTHRDAAMPRQGCSRHRPREHDEAMHVTPRLPLDHNIEVPEVVGKDGVLGVSNVAMFQGITRTTSMARWKVHHRSKR